jgi:HK97 family phage prohead protease
MTNEQRACPRAIPQTVAMCGRLLLERAMPDGSPRLNKQLAYCTLTVKSIDEEKREVIGIATTPSPDRMDDIVESKGAQFSLPLPFLMQHSAVPDDSIGHVVEAKVTPEGIRIRARIEKDPLLPELDKAWARIKKGLVRGLSIGFKPLEYEPINPKEPYGGLRFTKWLWLELSAVVIPANQDASITAIKSAFATSQAVPGRNATSQRGSLPIPAGAAASTFKGKTMLGLHEQLASLKQTRQTKAARMEELLGLKASGEFQDEQRGEFNALRAEIADIDDDVALKEVQIADSRTAVAVDVKAARGGQAPYGFVRKQDPDDKFKGQSETRRIIARALATVEAKNGNYVAPSVIAEQRYGKTNPMLVAVMKANEVPGLAGGSGEPFAELVSADNRYTGDFIEFLYSKTVFDRLPLRDVPANVAIKGMDGAFTGYWVGESKAIPMSNGSASSTSTTPLKVAALTTISNELLRDSSPSAERIVRDALEEALRQRIDTTFLSTSAASSGVSPAGILSGVSIGASNGGDAQSVMTDFRTLVGTFITAKNVGDLYLVMQPATALALGLMRNALGQPEFTPALNAAGGTFQGYPVITGDNVGSGDVILLKPSEIWRIGDMGVRVSVSQDATIEQSSAPTGEQDTPAAMTQAMVSMFQEESTAFKVVRPINWGKRRSSAVAYIGDAAYGVEQS